MATRNDDVNYKKHLLEGKKGPEKLEKIWFDPNANFATEIGDWLTSPLRSEIVRNTDNLLVISHTFSSTEDGGPPSDSPRSEWLDYQDEWERARAAQLAAEAIQNPTPSQKEDAKKKRAVYLKLADEVSEKKKKHSKQGRDKAADRKKPGKDKKSNKKSKRSHSK
ncbi:hypothetical protein PRIPAC_72062 [Pristionchus pacificus]|uniref:Uncharacterized protein n=1 Tax=Pristionchus pacificus TaxID=54126 RepID=A0A2A6C7U1_PRIPA|nr:hypothetical protein PRIPAC_72062 [Pristionchus pacificus]|eukprot:PDM74275.1 hypothetical protein PRIPAC_41631 [Pristionchus pacificus]